MKTTELKLSETRIDRIPFFFRDGTWDRGIFREVVTDDCYRVKNRAFESGAVVFDIGGHIGSFSRLIALTHPHVHVHVFEPHPENFTMLHYNTTGVENITAWNYGLSAFDGEGEMPLLSDNTGGGAVAPGVTEFGTDTFHVELMSVEKALDCIFEDAPRQISLVKFDCEGCECESLEPLINLADVEEIVGEWHGNECSKGVFRALKECGYTVQTKAILPSELGYFYAKKQLT